ncbi:membrane-bound lytic murein transglycosylase MltF [Acidiferrobacter sp.]|uniref:membrane-bound lytic murein transglycosylase MltF n=1 Tax=Acidiferrobacter sp. TaxID=1872107 RepID=UPI002614C9EB|nr:membrane-bound lytic murein transglycosylase MltF [Acidiferrobacter sp.]
MDRPYALLRALALAAFAVAMLDGCSSRHAQPKLVRLPNQKHGELVVLTRSGPTTYYQGGQGPAGMEYDMARDFADYLGLKLIIKVIPRDQGLMKALAAGQGDLVAGVTVTKAREGLARFGPPYQTVHEELVYRASTRKPTDARALLGHPIEVVAGSSAAAALAGLRADLPHLAWTDTTHMQASELLFLVWQGLLRFTVADSNVVAVNSRYYPALRVAFTIGPPRELAWAFPKTRDTKLYRAAFRFFAQLRRSGQLADLIARYYGVTQFNYVHIHTYLRRVRAALPLYAPLFRRAGIRYHIPWRLLAAVSYQESRWDADAESPTGVQGLMMLTNDTCLSVGVTDRLNPRQSIDGGARYLRTLLDALPADIPQPDRTWMALAAYNIGLNHLEDARWLTREQGANPDRWADVEQRLPLLEDPWWFRKTRYGYAAGYTAVQYVNRIRVYYRILRHLHQTTGATRSLLFQLSEPAI